MSKESLSFGGNEYLDLKNLDRQLEPQEFWQRFPLLTRGLYNPDILGEQIICTPHPGEHYRFGVYFYALSEQMSHDLKNQGNTIVIPSKDLFNKSGIQPNLLEKGVAVHLSPYHKRLLQEVKGERNLSNYGQALDVYRDIEENNITLDMGKYFAGIAPPVFSVPCQLSIDLSYLKRTP